MTDFEMSKVIAEKVKALGGRTYYVGGYVRDKFLHRDNKDIDIEIYNIAVEQLRDILDSIGKRTEFGKSFGVFGLKGYTIDIAMPRKERCIGIGHRDFEVSVDPFMSTYDAAKRRDLTMNALMEDVLTGEIVDHFGGVDDIKKRIIRHIDDKTFVEDALRVLRVAQFGARFNMTVAPCTVDLCRSVDITHLPAERVFEEMKKALLKSSKPSIFFKILDEMNQLNYWFNEVEMLKYVPQNEKYHTEGSVWNHTMMVLDNATAFFKTTDNPTAFMLTALCHDFGKIVATIKGNDGYTHSYGHENHGDGLITTFITKLTAEKDILEYVLNLSKYHMLPHQTYNNKSRAKKTNHMFDNAIDKRGLIYLANADSEGKGSNGYVGASAYDEFLWLSDRLRTYENTMSEPYVQGRDLVEAGLKPCKEFGELLTYSHKLRLAGINKEDTLRQTLAMAKKIIKTKN